MKKMVAKLICRSSSRSIHTPPVFDSTNAIVKLKIVESSMGDALCILDMI